MFRCDFISVALGIIIDRLRKKREDGKETDARHIISSYTIYRPSEVDAYSESTVQQRQLHESRGCQCVCSWTCVHAGWRAHRTGCVLFHDCVSGKGPAAFGGNKKRERESKKRKERLPRSACNPLCRLSFLSPNACPSNLSLSLLISPIASPVQNH